MLRNKFKNIQYSIYSSINTKLNTVHTNVDDKVIKKSKEISNSAKCIFGRGRERNMLEEGTYDWLSLAVKHRFYFVLFFK